MEQVVADEELHTAVRMSLELTAEDDVAARGFDMGCPDYTKGEKANLKWHVVVQGVEALIEEQGGKLDADKVMLWIDWACIDQDDVDEKVGVSQSQKRTYYVVWGLAKSEIPKTQWPKSRQ